MDGIVVKQRVFADQALDQALHLGQVEHAAHGGIGIALRKWRAGWRAFDGLAVDIAHDRLVDFRRHQLVKAQETPRHELRHLLRIEQMLFVDHAPVSSSFSNMKPYFMNDVLYSSPG